MIKLSGKVRVTIAVIVDPSATARAKMVQAIQETLNVNEGIFLGYISAALPNAKYTRKLAHKHAPLQ